MAKTSKKYFEEGFKNILWNQFLENIKKIKTGKELNLLFNKFFTPDEKIMIEKRLAILYLLEKDLSYRQISKEIDVTSKTISFTKRGFQGPTKRIPKENFQSNELKNLDRPKKKIFKYPTYTGRGRWRFLNNY